jgi:SAM-dependent methyltransferase
MQITTSFRSILNYPVIYDLFQNLMGASRVRRELVSDFIHPTEGMRILDIGCGTARILDFLPKVNYFGFDASQQYIDDAISRYGERGTFKCDTVEEALLRGEQSFDLVLAVGVLHHLDDESAVKLLRLGNSALTQGGRVVTVDPCFDLHQNPIAHFLISRDRGQNVRHHAQYSELAFKAFKKVDSFVRHRAWIPYTHCIMECTK